MKRLLVTGAAGFIGRHVLAHLADRDFEVVAVHHKQAIDAMYHRPGWQWQATDLLDPAAVDSLMAAVQPTHLLHLAWCPTLPGRFWTAASNLDWVQASLQLVRAFVSRGGQRLVMAGSCAEYDWRFGYCSESITPLSPTSLYGVCKAALYQIVNDYCLQQGVSAAWGRIFYLYGPHEYPQRLVASVARSLLKGEVAACTHGNQIRDFLHVEDVAGALLALLEQETTGAVNIASGQPITIRELVSTIARQLGRTDLLQLGAVPVAANEPDLLLANVTRLRQEVGWQPRYTLEEGVRHTIRWWQNHVI
jgi:nucleoside-diphosphate-sugar epimerase